MTKASDEQSNDLFITEQTSHREKEIKQKMKKKNVSKKIESNESENIIVPTQCKCNVFVLLPTVVPTFGFYFLEKIDQIRLIREIFNLTFCRCVVVIVERMDYRSPWISVEIIAKL